jgi:NAD(P)-dependent dehydrogenase (short-subunit alcohol dehydrogenase family)
MTTHILVTGTSRGIGRAILDRFAGDDVRLIGQATTESATSIAADFADPASPSRLWPEALDRLDGRIDVLVNNAGVFEAADIALPDDAWRAIWNHTMQVNLTAAAELSRLAVLHMRERDGGRIVNVASRAAYRGDSPAHWHYAASKAGMVAMTKSIARAMRPRACSPLRSARLHHDRHGRGVSGQPRRRQAARRHPARPGRRPAEGRRGGAVPGAGCAAVDDGRGDRHQRASYVR